MIKKGNQPIQEEEVQVASWSEAEIQDLKLKHSLINLNYKVNQLQQSIYRFNQAAQKAPFSK
ncbi:MAG: hypothetical protein AAF518_13310 [Spirochaetota bacterium]